MGYLMTLIVLGVLVFIHELGHLIAAKAFAIPVARFSVGFGPKVWGKQVGATEDCVSLLPFGGYVLPALDAEALQNLSW